MQHDIWIEEIGVDEQSTVWIMHCNRCKRRTRPLAHKSDAEAASEEDSCPGPPKTVEKFNAND